ncbi:hypothetical protein RP300_02145 [Oligella urethralis]|nr:hypothetical protein RP300_01584 [Oligella urethralis]WOS38568.1 hypothetical protein RP300_02145 [Oligella urethralis]
MPKKQAFIDKSGVKFVENFQKKSKNQKNFQVEQKSAI